MMITIFTGCELTIFQVKAVKAATTNLTANVFSSCFGILSYWIRWSEAYAYSRRDFVVVTVVTPVSTGAVSGSLEWLSKVQLWCIRTCSLRIDVTLQVASFLTKSASSVSKLYGLFAAQFLMKPSINFDGSVFDLQSWIAVVVFVIHWAFVFHWVNEHLYFLITTQQPT